MALTRRTLLHTAGATALVLTSGAGGGALVQATATADPRAAWASAGSHPDPRVRTLGYAILAPNPHNRQPWLAELVGEDEITLRCDLDRRLPETDPFDRQITIGFGCFLELLRMAAAAEGRAATIEGFPEGEPGARLDGRPVARVRLGRAGDATPDPLFPHVLARRSNKGLYDMARPVAPEVLDRVRGAAARPETVSATADPALVERLRDVTWRGFITEARSHGPHMESVNLIRLGRPEVAANPDGISLDAPRFEPLARQANATRAALADPASPAFAQMLTLQRAPVSATPAYLWLATPANARRDQLDAGRDWVRLNLAATGLGLGLHPQSAALQEYPEMDGLLREVHRALDVERGRVQMLGRIGYTASESPPSPRWPVETRIRPA